MTFPAHIERVLADYGVRADTKAALYDLYLSMGDEVLEVFADLASGCEASALHPEETATIRTAVVERYLGRNHPKWVAGHPTASLWHPREAEGRASGAAVPLGDLPAAAGKVVGAGQVLPDGILMLGRNAHFGGRSETISFDIVARELADAVAIGLAAGQQHTLPGSVGETSATYDSERNLALVWEVQPNVYKPSGERNRAITRLYRRHRNWHLATLAAALDWLRGKGARIFVLRGSALAVTHEVNRAKPVSATIVSLHDRTVGQVTRAMGLGLAEPTGDDELALLEAGVMNHALRKHVLREGAAGAVVRVGS